jgi:chromosome segregation ATPase
MNQIYRHKNEIRESINQLNRELNLIITQINQTIMNQDAAIHEHLHELRQQRLIQQNLKAAITQESNICRQQKDDFNQQIQRLQTMVTALETKLADVDRKLAAIRGEAH